MRVAVVGAGVGGLAVAARLARSGRDVDIFESGPRVGGKMQAVFNEAGLRWDTGPTLVTLPEELQETFQALAHPGSQAPALLPLHEGTDIHFDDGNRWQLPAPGHSFVRWMESVDTILARQCEPLLAMASEVFRFAQEHILQKEPPGLLELGLRTTLGGLALRHPDLARMDYLRFIESRLTCPRARELFLHFCSYVGVLPEHASAALISIAHVELAMPVVFPKGGVYEIARYLESAAHAHGAKVQVDARVRSAVPLGGTDTGNAGWELRLEGEDGARRYDALVVATDPHQALVDWLDAPTVRRQWYGEVVDGRLAPSESQFVVLFDREENTPLAHHVKIFPRSWSASYRETRQGKLPEDPCVYAVWPHATDAALSPRLLFLSAMAPSLESGHSWDAEQCATYAGRILEIARRRLGRTLPGRIVETVSPMDLYRRTGSLRGGLYGASPTRFRQAAFARPSSFPRVPGLFFVGGGVHPGAGVPMVLMGARRVASNILALGSRKGRFGGRT